MALKTQCPNCRFIFNLTDEAERELLDALTEPAHRAIVECPSCHQYTFTLESRLKVKVP